MNKPNKVANSANKALDTYISVGFRLAVAAVITSVIVSSVRKIKG